MCSPSRLRTEAPWRNRAFWRLCARLPFLNYSPQKRRGNVSCLPTCGFPGIFPTPHNFARPLANGKIEDIIYTQNGYPGWGGYHERCQHKHAPTPPCRGEGGEAEFRERLPVGDADDFRGG